MDEAGFVETVNHAGERIFSGRAPRGPLSRPDGRATTLSTASSCGASRLPRPALVDGAREVTGRRRDGTHFRGISSAVQIGTRLLLRYCTRPHRAQTCRGARAAPEDVRRNEILAAIGSLVAGSRTGAQPVFGISAVLDAFTARFGERAEYAERCAAAP
jgi:hypothetical protein